MAVTKKHFSLGWGLVEADFEQANSPSYEFGTDYVEGGADAIAGIGVRTATLILDRTNATPADDDMNMHFTFLNFTSGSPDDTWTSADYASLEARLSTWFQAMKPYVPSYARFSRILWHKEGKGITKPNPATRILDIASPGSGTVTSALPPQSSCAISLRTGLRRHWGRTYLPFAGTLDSTQRVSTAARSAIVAATVTLLQGAMTDDFSPVVYSGVKQQAYGVEFVAVDDTVDIQRRRRWKHSLGRVVTPL